MNNDFSNCSSSVMDSIRKAGIGCRGRVRTRGGRLPPVRLQHVLPSKKVVAPKIPQKRIKVKKEEQEQKSKDERFIRQEKEFYCNRGRGRERKQRVYIQTEGALFEDGPSQKIKREGGGYERISVPRSFRNFKKSEDTNISYKAINNLLDSHSDGEDESDSEYDLKPIKFPYMKEVKQVKKEISPEDVAPFIKAEPRDEPAETPIKDEMVSESKEKKFFTKIKPEHLFEGNGILEDVKRMENDGLMMLLQLPSSLPIDISTDEPEDVNKKKLKDDKNSNEENTVEKQDTKIPEGYSIYDLPEGYIGKFQVLKSGKMRLVMGDVIINFETASASDYLAEVVSIPVIEEKNNSMVVLGNITRKMILEPHLILVTE